jgi:CheY-like chemotaxis protein
MQKKQKQKQKSFIVKLSFICVLIIIIGQFFYILKSTHLSNDSDVYKSQLALIEKKEDIKKTFQLILSTLTFCKEKKLQNISCDQEQVKILTRNLDEEITVLMDMAAQEKKLLSMSGLLDFDYIRLSLKKYEKTNDLITLQVELINSADEFSKLSDNIHSIIIYEADKETQKKLYLIIVINIILVCVFIVGWILVFKIQREYKSQKNQLTKTFTHILSDVKDLNHDSLTKRISNTSATPSEKKIYSMLLYSYEKLENEMSKTDLYQRLYNLLGNEIRGITNTIQGGINLLVDEEDEQKKLQAMEIVTATRTLENLAENFNLISSVDLFSDNKSIDFYQLASELIVLLATKSKQRNKTIESYVSNTIPSAFYGNQTGLFWILLMQVSDTISSSDSKHILFTIGCTTAQRVDKLQIHIDLYLYESPIPSIAAIEGLPWGIAPKKIITNKALAETLLGSLKNYQVIQKNTEGVSRVRISFDISPAAYQTENNKLHGRKFLICGDSYMQVDVIEKMLFDHGADVIIARNPNEIFTSLKLLRPHDGIFLTDTIHGVNLKTFCKIIKARMTQTNIKIFLSFSTARIEQNIYEHVDHIFYHPCPPLDFISSIVEHLDKDESEDEADVSEKILVVEDDKLQQFILKKILGEFDFECDTADDGKEAISKVQENEYKVIFMDCIMPNVDGLEATEEIRRIESEQNLIAKNIIGATALTSKDEHKKCIDSGMNFVIHKPYKKDEIFRVLKKYLAVKKVN